MFFEKLFDFIKNNSFWLSAILLIIISVWLTLWFTFEIRKLKKYLNDNGVQRNNISEILRVQRMILNILGAKDNNPEVVDENIEVDNINTKKQINKKEKYSEEEIGSLILDISMELKKTNARLKNWRNFGILIIIFIILTFIKIIIQN